MDGSTVEHSDSDSGESWTLLENSPTYGDEAPDALQDNIANTNAREHVDIHSDKDEDTDGISIISDSETESTPCDLNYVKISTEESPANIQEIPLLAPSNNASSHKKTHSVEETDYLGDNVKYKTYVHKRNPKVGSILDVIMLGTFVITAGMALGHLWSCKNECTTHTSVNKILSNLYKLQEENAFLRSKLKEITEATSYQLTQQRKPTTNKPNKQFRCKKIFEEPVLKNNKLETAIKCVDDNKPDMMLHDSIPEHERDFLNDIDRMKNIYDQNKEWLDPEVKRQFDEFDKAGSNPKQNNHLDIEKQLGPIIIPLAPNLPDVVKDTKTDTEKVKTHKQINLEKQLGPTYYEIPLETKQNSQQDISSTDSNITVDPPTESNIGTRAIYHTSPMNPDLSSSIEQSPEKKIITYADSLKTDQPLQRYKRSGHSDLSIKRIKERFGKRKRKDDDIVLNLNSFSDDSIKKDDRYTPKTKHEKKKHDRQKSHRRQKRINKYEQWEMKGGYLKDFDEFSVTSSQDNDILANKPERKFLNADFENYVNMLIEADNNASNKELPKTTKNVGEGSGKGGIRFPKGEKAKKKGKEFEWYDQRAALRANARMKLEQELFGENSPNTAAWYFRRMQKREQCRAQKDNSTFKKFTKRKMNFKMKR